MVVAVAPYKDPDLDGVACSIAYSEFLRYKGKEALPAICGTPSPEARYVLRRLNIKLPEEGEKTVKNSESIILVDASDLRGISDNIDPGKVEEIIDHRKVHSAERFPDAKLQIELVGSAATLIAERFYKDKVAIKEETAALLYSAIVSNTINFKAGITTIRDHRMGEWLNTIVKIPERFVHEVFSYKSEIHDTIYNTLRNDFARYEFGGKRLGIVQLEILNVKIFFEKNKEEIIKTLSELKKEYGIDHIMLTCVDLKGAFNLFFTEDKNLRNILSSAIDADFEDNLSVREGLLMRKEIVPVLKEYLEDPVKETIRAYDGYSEDYQNIYPEVDIIKDQIERFVRYVGEKEGAKVLDVGCGHGRDAKHFLELGYDVTGIDLSEGLLKIAKENAPGSTFLKMDMRHLDFAQGSFDGIWACASFLHVPWREAKDTLVGFVRVLKKGGVACISVKEGDSEEYVKKDHYKGGVKFFAYYKEDEIKILLEKAGLEVIDISIDKKKDRWINVFGKKDE